MTVAPTTIPASDYSNLYLAGSGLFPHSGPANPILTAAALALLTADAITRDLCVQVTIATPVASPEASPFATPAAS